MNGSIVHVLPAAIRGTVEAPVSKSILQRAVALAALAAGPSKLRARSGAHWTLCHDCRAALGIAQQLGAAVSTEPATITIDGIGFTPGQRLGLASAVIDCHESGLCLRMFAPVAALFADPCRLTGSGSLSRRPAGMIAKALSSFGVAVTTSGGNIPLDVRGPLRGGAQEIDGSESSQHITGLLIALPLAPDSSLVTVRPLSSRPYIDLTLNMVRQFGGAVAEDASPSVGGAVFRIDGGQGYRGCECEIEGDWSAAAFILAAAALTGQATVTGLSLASAQADRRILDALTAAGAAVTAGDSAVTVERRALRGFEFDCVHCPDLFPPLAAVAAFCQGTTRLTGANRLAGKESDRAAALEAELSRIGAKINRTGDVLEIIGGHVSGGEVSAHNDHRIAMAAAVAGLASRHGVTIAGAECTAKSWPDFFAVLGGMRNDECGRRNAE